jgi:hypothetical protein
MLLGFGRVLVVPPTFLAHHNPVLQHCRTHHHSFNVIRTTLEVEKELWTIRFELIILECFNQ